MDIGAALTARSQLVELGPVMDYVIESPTKPFWGLMGREKTVRYELQVSAGKVDNRFSFEVSNGGRGAKIIRDGLLDPAGVADADQAVMESVWNTIAKTNPKSSKNTFGVFLNGVEEGSEGNTKIYYDFRPLTVDVKVRGKIVKVPFSLSNPIIDASHGWRRLVAHEGRDGKAILPSGSISIIVGLAQT